LGIPKDPPAVCLDLRAVPFSRGLPAP
jgi:hypothetical protein